MLSEEDAAQIKKMIYEEVTKSFLALPEIVVKMMNQRAAMVDKVKSFYTENPEWKKHTDVVQSVIEEVEAKNPGIPVDEIVNKAKPDIQKRLNTIGKLDLQKIDKPKQRTFEPKIGDYGEL